MTNPRLSLAQAIAASLTPAESALAADLWFTYMQLSHSAEGATPEQAEFERRRLDVAGGRIDGVWRAFLATRGYDQLEWDVRLVNVSAGPSAFAAGGGGLQMPAGANKYGVNLSPRTRPPC